MQFLFKWHGLSIQYTTSSRKETGAAVLAGSGDHSFIVTPLNSPGGPLKIDYVDSRSPTQQDTPELLVKRYISRRRIIGERISKIFRRNSGEVPIELPAAHINELSQQHTRKFQPPPYGNGKTQELSAQDSNICAELESPCESDDYQLNMDYSTSASDAEYTDADAQQFTTPYYQWPLTIATQQPDQTTAVAPQYSPTAVFLNPSSPEIFGGMMFNEYYTGNIHPDFPRRNTHPSFFPAFHAPPPLQQSPHVFNFATNYSPFVSEQHPPALDFEHGLISPPATTTLGSPTSPFTSFSTGSLPYGPEPQYEPQQDSIVEPRPRISREPQVEKPKEPLVCLAPGCTKTFTGYYQKGNRARHVKCCHSDLIARNDGALTDSRKLKCTICEKGFKRSDARKKHEWREHGVPDAKPTKRY